MATNDSGRGARRAFYHVQWAGLLGSACLLALYLAWLLLARADFLYARAYEILDIDRTIANYGPRNRYRGGFERTTRAERERLFSRIVDAVRNDGAGLEEMVYHDARGAPLGPLLTHPEIVHLQDVARLIHGVDLTGSMAALAWGALLALARWRRLPFPALRRYGLGGGLVLAAVIAGVLWAGPERIFYRMHTWIFPDDHPWFFYYEDSLMTMLMKAPDLFGLIAVELIVVALPLYAVLVCLMRKAVG